jgi:hypothetical protein
MAVGGGAQEIHNSLVILAMVQDLAASPVKMGHFAPVSPSGLLLSSSNGTPADAAFPQSPAF